MMKEDRKDEIKIAKESMIEKNIKEKERDWVRGSALSICHPQCFTTSTSLQGFHWKPNQRYRQNWTHSPVAMKRNPITSEIIRADCSWSVALLRRVCFLCECVCLLLNIITHGWDLVTMYTLCDEEHCVSIVYYIKTVRISQERGNENVSPSGLWVNKQE